MAGRAGHEQIDDSLGLSRIMGRARSGWLAHGVRSRLAIKQRCKRHPAQPDAAIAQKPAPGNLSALVLRVCVFHSRVAKDREPLGACLSIVNP